MKSLRIALPLAALVALALPASSFGAGLLQSSASPGSASGSPADLTGLLTLGQSSSTSDSSGTNVLSVAGTDLLSKNDDGTNSGALAPVGDVVDSLNGALCPDGPVDEDGVCIVALYSNASSTETSDDTGTQDTHNSSYTTLGVTAGDQGVYVLGSAASSTEQVPTGGEGECTDLAGSYILTTKDSVPGVPDDALSENSTSLGQPCP